MREVFFLIIIATCLCSCKSKIQDIGEPGSIPMESLRTFGTMGKELRVLKKDEETELFQYRGKGCLTHMWFGGSFKGVEYTDIRIYVDGEEEASIDMELFLGHGIGFGDNFAPWGTKRMGNIGGNSGIYNTYKIPFGSSIRITAQLAPDAGENPMFWWIIRGTENLPLQIGGVPLPGNARLKLYKLENHVAEPLEEFAICDVEGSGLLYQVTMEAKGLRDTDHWRDLSYMEACVRAYTDGSEDPLFLSSGLEDYFLGTYYFNKGRYTNMLAGLTHIDKEKNEFSGYRLHEDDPVFYQDGLRLTNRCGEKIGEKIFHDPPPTRYTTYTWIYEW
jgi:hypothetical protein